jgi:peptidoglycan/xylan/chitin deacetylase (PgdA/CDA1 family)
VSSASIQEAVKQLAIGGALPKKIVNLELTFDDGPEPVKSALRPILQEIESLHVMAAFFVLGQEVQHTHSSIAEIRGAGHEIGNHSWDHFEPTTSIYTDQQIYDQFKRTHAEVKSAGYEMHYWRAPRLEQWDRIQRIITARTALGPPIYSSMHCDWQADSKDSQRGVRTADQMIKNIEGELAKNPGMRMPDGTRAYRLLFHVKDQTAVALPEVLEYLAGRGHRFISFSQSR